MRRSCPSFRAQYLLEPESHPSLQDFNLRCLGPLLMIVWEPGRTFSQRSAGVLSECCSLWEKLLPDTKHVRMSTIVSSKIGLKTADRKRKCTVWLTSKLFPFTLLNLMELLIWTQTDTLSLHTHRHTYIHTHRFTYAHLDTPHLEQNGVKLSPLSGGGDWRA